MTYRQRLRRRLQRRRPSDWKWGTAACRRCYWRLRRLWCPRRRPESSCCAVGTRRPRRPGRWSTRTGWPPSGCGGCGGRGGRGGRGGVAGRPGRRNTTDRRARAPAVAGTAASRRTRRPRGSCGCPSSPTALGWRTATVAASSCLWRWRSYRQRITCPRTRETSRY